MGPDNVSSPLILLNFRPYNECTFTFIKSHVTLTKALGKSHHYSNLTNEREASSLRSEEAVSLLPTHTHPATQSMAQRAAWASLEILVEMQSPRVNLNLNRNL